MQNLEKSLNRSSDENARDLAEVQLRLAQIFGQQIQRGLACCQLAATSVDRTLSGLNMALRAMNSPSGAA
jgi:hypothetical protein